MRYSAQSQDQESGNNVNATADFQFSLWVAVDGPAQIGSTRVVNNMSIAEGLFTVEIDFGAAAFGTEARWLDISVRSPAGDESVAVEHSPKPL